MPEIAAASARMGDTIHVAGIPHTVISTKVDVDEEGTRIRIDAERGVEVRTISGYVDPPSYVTVHLSGDTLIEVTRDDTTPPAVEVTDAMVVAFGEAWGNTPEGKPGDRRRAGIAAALAAR